MGHFDQPDRDDEQARQQFERERMTRRQALRKFGITTGATLFGMFAVDDLARLALSKMKEHKQTQEIAETLSQEFANSGVAFAQAGSVCQGCYNTYYCATNTCNTCTQPGQPGANQKNCYTYAGNQFNDCYSKHCVNGATGQPPTGGIACPACVTPISS